MVGVPGRSKGCTTCRRRRVRCNQERPHCSNCVRIGRPCEGYERYAIFINRTPQGLLKREPLEEAKSSASSGAKTAAVAGANTKCGPGSAVLQNAIAVHIPPNPSTGAVWSAGLLSWFWEKYSSTDVHTNTRASGPLWLYLAMGIANPTAALHQSLLALSMVRRGRANNDDFLVHEGQRIYGQALILIQRGLRDRRCVAHEENLAAVRAMVLYELYEATSDSVRSWQNHVSGLASLIESRGPHSYDTPLARSVFEEFRYPLLIQCLMSRQGGAFAEPQWQTAPWTNATKDREQVLYDYGFSLAALLERADSLSKTAGNPPWSFRLELLLGIIKSSQGLNNDLNQFRIIYLSDSTATFDFQGLLMVWWVLKLILALLSNRVATKALETIPHLPVPAQPRVQILCRQLQAFSDHASRSHMGHNILASIEAMLEQNIGQFWLSRTIFPLAIAASQFQGSGVQLETCRRIKDEVGGGKGFRFANGIDSQPALQSVFVS